MGRGKIYSRAPSRRILKIFFDHRDGERGGKRAILEHLRNRDFENFFNHGEDTKSHTKTSQVSIPVLLE